MTITIRAFLLTVSIACVLSTVGAHAENLDTSEYIIPEFTFSPNKRLAVMIPVFQDSEIKPVTRKNQIIELSSRKLITAINAMPGYDRPLNHLKIAHPI